MFKFLENVTCKLKALKQTRTLS